MVNSLIAIATFVTLIGGVIFGIKQFEKKSDQEERLELVKPAQPLEQQVIPEPTTRASAEEVTAPPTTSVNNGSSAVEKTASTLEASYEEDPWSELQTEATETTEAEASQTVLDLGEIPSAERDEQSYEDKVAVETTNLASDQLDLNLTEEVVPLEASVAGAVEVSEPATESVSEAVEPVEAPTAEMPSEELEPRYQVEEVVIPPTIHDPKRPNSETLENLTQDILAWGESKDLKHLPKLMQSATSSDNIVRGNVAIALGQIAAGNPVRKELEQAIPVLGKLTQDSNLQVRQFAVEALGAIRSEKVLPYLESALLSPSGGVKKAANDAIQSLKLHYGKSPAMQIAQQMLEKPKSKV